MNPLRSSLLLAALLAPANSLAAQANQYGPYTADSFEAPRFPLGLLAGHDMYSQPDGWMLFDDILGLANLPAAQVQNAVVRSGRQAVRWDAGQMAPGAFGELRRNALFNLTTGVIEIECDLLLTPGSNPSAAWGVYTQPAPHPQTAQLWWEIASNGEIVHCTTPNRLWLGSGHYVTRGAWHHTRSVVDITNNTTRIYLDGVLAAQGQPCGVYTNLPAHGFTQFTVRGAGDDMLYIDNFTVRERTAVNGLSVDLARLPIGQRSVMTFRLAGAPALGGSSYALLGSMAGSSPGIQLPGGAVLPLVPDAFLGICAAALGSQALPGFLGQLSPDGTAEAVFDTAVPLPASMLGLAVTFAWFTYYPTIAVSEPIRVLVTP